MPHRENLLIYGCYGYTGKLISELATQQGLRPVLAGRDAARTRELADVLQLPYLVFDIENTVALREALSSVKAVLHCAGPFVFTAKKMAEACIATRTHYMDITGEYQVFELLYRMNDAAEKAGILLLPGVGFDVVPSDCLAMHMKERLPTAHMLDIILSQQGGRISHGTAITIAENLGEPTMVRKRSKLTPIPAGSLTHEREPDEEGRMAVAISWGDISSAFRSTGIPNITVYNKVPQRLLSNIRMSHYLSGILKWRMVRNFIIGRIKKRAAGPDSEQRKSASTTIWAEAKNNIGANRISQLTLPEGYTLTAMTAVKIAQHVLSNTIPAGAKTPAQVFGKDFILQFEGVTRTDIV